MPRLSQFGREIQNRCVGSTRSGGPQKSLLYGRFRIVVLCVVSVATVVWGGGLVVAREAPDAVLIKLPPGQLPEVVPLFGSAANAGVAERGILLWSNGPKQFIQAYPIKKDLASSGEELAFGSRGGPLDAESATQPGEALSLPTANLEQIRGIMIFKGKGFLTPAEKEHLLSGQICVRRSLGKGSTKYPAVVVDVVQGSKTVCEIPFAENQPVMKWADVPNLPESLKAGLPSGEYSLRARDTRDTTVFVVDDAKTRDFVLQVPQQLTAILETKSDSLFLQVAVNHLLGQVDGNGVHRPYYSDALELLDSAPPESLTPWLKSVREDILVSLGAEPADKRTAPKKDEEETGIEPIDKARRLIAEGSWDEATAFLSGSDVSASPRSKGLALLYRAVILSESGPSLEDEACTLFTSAITALSDGDPRDIYRAHINYANFLMLRAQDRLYNHAFEIASGIPNSLTQGLTNWREALKQYKCAGTIAKALDDESQAAVDVSLARTYSFLADVLQTLGPSVDLERDVAMGEEAARTAAAGLCRTIISKGEGSISPMTSAAAHETLAHIAFRQGNAKDCRDHASQARKLYLATGSLPGIEGIHRLLGLLELKESKSVSAGPEVAKARKAALQDLLISHFLSELLRNRIPTDRIGILRAGYFARRAYVSEQIMETLICEGRHAEALEFAELAKARALQDVLVASAVLPGTQPGASRLIKDVLASWPNDIAALEYFLGTERAWVFVVAVSGDVTVHPLLDSSGNPIRSRELIAQVREFLSSIGFTAVKMRSDILSGKGMDDSWQDTLHQFCQTLLPRDALDKIGKAKTVIVIPHHILHYFPFASLVTELDQRERSPYEIAQPKFLLDKSFSLCYCPSLSASNLLSSHAVSSTGRISAFGLVDFQHAQSLPGVADELAGIEKAFGRKPDKLLMNEQATVASAKALLKNRGFLFVGTHGRNIADRPLASYLQCSPERDDRGQLTAAEIFSLPVGADIVVLSACYSGLADRSPMPGDDLFGLQRALIQSGARSVVSGQWDVYDGTAPLVMTTFFRQLAAGEPVAAALANAQRRFLQEQRVTKAPNPWLHPYFWAVYTVAGDYRTCMKSEGDKGDTATRSQQFDDMPLLPEGHRTVDLSSLDATPVKIRAMSSGER